MRRSSVQGLPLQQGFPAACYPVFEMNEPQTLNINRLPTGSPHPLQAGRPSAEAFAKKSHKSILQRDIGSLPSLFGK